jgi:hypothetical protein
MSRAASEYSDSSSESDGLDPFAPVPLGGAQHAYGAPSAREEGLLKDALGAAEAAHLLHEGDVDAYLDGLWPAAGERVRAQAKKMGAHAAALTSARANPGASESESVEVFSAAPRASLRRMSV